MFSDRRIDFKGRRSVSRGISHAMFCLILWGVIGCSKSSHTDQVLNQLKNKRCTVFFRHDILGQADSIPSNFDGDVINGARVSLTGKLLSSNQGWISIETDSRIFHIPIANVLLVASSMN